jgi:hypothetical protein
MEKVHKLNKCETIEYFKVPLQQFIRGCEKKITEIPEQLASGLKFEPGCSPLRVKIAKKS